MKRVLNTVMLTAFVFLSSCGSELAYKYTERATIGYTTAIHNDLISLPPPKEKVVVAVYKFRDQTGQYKTSAQATTFSTAVTQGATSMLNKALEDSGWFIPIEREGLPNLLNERQIIRSTRTQYASEGGNQLPPLPPLLYAGVLLEGGIIGYDTNLITGGLGVQYFGVGGSGKLRKDQVTIYLRLVSTKNGQVLKSVSTTKSVLSREVDFGIYRFIRIKRLLEAETGLSTNEPPSMCVLESVEKAVYDLIVEGVQDGIWELKNPEDINSPAIQKYLKEKQQTEKIVTFNKKGRLVEVKDVEKVEKPEPEEVEKPEPQEIEKPQPEDIEKTQPEQMEKPEAEQVPQPHNVKKTEEPEGQTHSVTSTREVRNGKEFTRQKVYTFRENDGRVITWICQDLGNGMVRFTKR